MFTSSNLLTLFPCFSLSVSLLFSLSVSLWSRLLSAGSVERKRLTERRVEFPCPWMTQFHFSPKNERVRCFLLQGFVPSGKEIMFYIFSVLFFFVSRITAKRERRARFSWNMGEVCSMGRGRTRFNLGQTGLGWGLHPPSAPPVLCNLIYSSLFLLLALFEHFECFLRSNQHIDLNDDHYHTSNYLSHAKNKYVTVALARCLWKCQREARF